MAAVNLAQVFRRADQHVKSLLKDIDAAQLPRAEREMVRKLKLVCTELRLDIRDYEYAETRQQQLKWARITHHNLKALETLITNLPDIFGPADVAELGAVLHHLRSGVYYDID